MYSVKRILLLAVAVAIACSVFTAAAGDTAAGYPDSDTRYNLRVQCIYDSIELAAGADSLSFDDEAGCLLASQGGKRGILNMNGETVIPIIYDNVMAFGEYFMTDLGNTRVYYTRYGREIRVNPVCLTAPDYATSWAAEIREGSVIIAAPDGSAAAELPIAFPVTPDAGSEPVFTMLSGTVALLNIPDIDGKGNEGFAVADVAADKWLCPPEAGRAGVTGDGKYILASADDGTGRLSFVLDGAGSRIFSSGGEILEVAGEIVEARPDGNALRLYDIRGVRLSGDSYVSLGVQGDVIRATMEVGGELRQGALDAGGRAVIPFEFVEESFSGQNDRFLIFHRPDGKPAVFGHDGAPIAPAGSYDGADTDGSAFPDWLRVSRDGMQTLIDCRGRELIRPVDGEIIDFNGTLAICKSAVGTASGRVYTKFLTDASGTLLELPSELLDIYFLHQPWWEREGSCAFVRTATGAGLLTFDGREVFPPVYGAASVSYLGTRFFEYGYSILVRGSRYGVVDMNGRAVVPFGLFDTISAQTAAGTSCVMTVGSGGRFGIITLPLGQNTTGDLPRAWAADEIARATEMSLLPSGFLRGYGSEITADDLGALLANVALRKTGLTPEMLAGQIALIRGVEPPDASATAIIPVLSGQAGRNSLKAAEALGLLPEEHGLKPYDTLTRVQAARIFADAADLLDKIPLDRHNQPGAVQLDPEFSADATAAGADAPSGQTAERALSDIAGLPEDGREAIERAMTAGIMRGKPDGRFDPGGALTREQAYVAALRLYEYNGAR